MSHEHRYKNPQQNISISNSAMYKKNYTSQQTKIYPIEVSFLGICSLYQDGGVGASLVVQLVKNLPAKQDAPVQFLG